MSRFSAQFFYHVTHVDHLQAILSSEGIKGTKKKNGWKFAYYVKRDDVAWAISHISARHDWRIGEMVVCQITASSGWMKQIGHEKIWATRHVYMPKMYTPALEWLIREERQIMGRAKKMEFDDLYEHLREAK